MKTLLLALLLVMAVAACNTTAIPPEQRPPEDRESVALPQVRLVGEMTVEEALYERRSIREYADAPLALEDISQLLWAAQGITVGWGGRTAPSAGGLYPLEVYLVAGEVIGLEAGIYRYIPHEHEVVKIRSGDVREELTAASVRQSCVRDGAITLVISAVYERTTVRYGDRGVRYVHMEAGHAAQNVYLQAVALDLGTVVVGAFNDDEVKDLLEMPKEESPLYVIPVGRITAGA